MKGRCRKGHKVEGSNAYTVPSSGRMRCIMCKKDYNTQWHRRSRGSKWTAEEYNAAFLKQQGECAICGNKDKLCGDHCHLTGKSRELLCSRCNMFLGILEQDLDALRKFVEYLQKHKAL
jgi:Recombination endonuclease VII